MRLACLVLVGLVVVSAAYGVGSDSNGSLWTSLEQSSLYQRYAKANPAESARVKAYWLDGAAKPAVATAFGRFLVEVNEDRAPVPPPPPPPPPPAPQCSDGVDNDGNGHIDYPGDAGCSSAADTTEAPVASPPPTVQCADGVDNDGDGRVDYPADPGCSSAADTDEADAIPPPPPPPGGTAPWLGSFNASYQNAQPGQTVVVPAGSYGTQVIAFRSLGACDPNNAAQLVTLRVASAVTINGDLEVHGPCVFISGVASGSMADWKARSFTLNVTGYTSVEGDSFTQWPRGVRFEGLNTGNLITASSEQVIVRDADVGPRLLDVPCQFPENRISSNGASGKQVRDVLWERVAIHDQNRTQAAANQDCHYGGLQVWNVANLTIRDSVFERNVVYHIDVDQPSNFRLERVRWSCPSDNSWLGDRCDGQRAVQFNASSQSATLVDNVVANGPNGLYGCYSPSCSLSGVNESGTVNLAESTTAPPVP